MVDETTPGKSSSNTSWKRIIQSSNHSPTLIPHLPVLNINSPIMYMLRRAAFRAVSASTLPAAKPRTLTSLASSPIRSRIQISVPAFQRRLASDEAPVTAAKVTDETVPEKPSESESQAISEHQPEQQSGTSGRAPTNFTDTPESSSAAQQASSTIGSAVASATNAVRQGASRLQEGAQSAFGNARQREPRPAQPSSRLYVGNIQFEVNEDQLRSEYEQFGTVKAVTVAKDYRGLSKGFAFVEFEEVSQATAALNALDQRVLSGRRMNVQYHTPRAGDKPMSSGRAQSATRTLFIGNMSFEMTDKDLNDLFREVKNVIDVRVAIDRRSGQPRGFAHADFIDVASAERAKAMLEQKVIHGRKLRIDFSAGSSPNSRSRDTPSA